ncbi:MAG: RsmB/NOP family class I SAM-dependent RNA methyltransferase [Hyphomicrobiales bacterium]|nr:RsmB/NOP family class I SAM-dependent RNA methyltransferase [Hyphomicrobiales bacterium]
MTPGARLAAAIDLLTETAATRAPTAAVLERYFRARRYAGSGDRRAIAERVYGLLRRHARLGWWLDRGRLPDTPRARVLADLVLGDGLDPAAAAAPFGAGPHAPAALDDAEAAFAAAVAGQPLDHGDMPDPVRLEYPAWLDASLRRAFGDGLDDEMAAANRPAPLDLRVNVLKTNRDGARKAFARDGVEVAVTPLSPRGLRLDPPRRVEDGRAYKGGLVEVQDEGSQIVALLADARPGLTVVDYCAGAGGKTLAMAAEMQGRGRLIACDTDAARLDRLRERQKCAGPHNVERVALDADGTARLLRKVAADRVLVDAPCSGSGTWRRDPAARWRLDPAALDDLLARQRTILARAAGLVAPGGRLVYATCSVLPEENADQVARFVSEHDRFSVLPVTELWQNPLDGTCPCAGPFLELTPARHGTDGFFAAILARNS